MRSRLPLLAAGLALAVPSSALAADLPASSTAILSGTTSLRDSLPAPAGRSKTTRTAVSQDGRFVAFASSSDGLLEGDDDRFVNVYVKDRSNGEVRLASRANGPTGEPAHDDCDDPAISDDGRRVAFVCDGPLDPAADGNGRSDVYLRDLQSGATHLVSRAGGLGPVGDQQSGDPVLDETGEHVAFVSSAANLDPLASAGQFQRVYVRRIGSGNATKVVSRRSGTMGQPVNATEPSISDDANLVAFTSGETVDETNDKNSASDVYVRDLTLQTTALVSRSGAAGAIGNRESSAAALAGNGKSIAFQSRASTFDPVDTDDQVDVYWRSLTSGVTFAVSRNKAGTKGNGPSTAPTIADDGTRVGFLSRSTNLEPVDANSGVDAYVKDLNDASLEIVSVNDGLRTVISNGASSIALGGEGGHAAVSVSRGLTDDVDPRLASVIVRDLSTSTRLTSTVSRPGGTAPFVNVGGGAAAARISDDGRFAVFVSDAVGLPAGVDRGIVVRDRITGAISLVSRENGADGAPMTGNFGRPDISADGSRVAFPHTDGHVYVRDLTSGTTLLADRADGANGLAGNKQADAPVLDADGSRVAFQSNATNLGNGDTTDDTDVHLRDFTTGSTILVSRADGAAGAKGDGPSTSPSINAAGTRVAFSSDAKNLGDGDADAVRDVHLRDVAAGQTILVSANGAAKGDAPSAWPSIDAAGMRVAFQSRASNLPGAPGQFDQVYVRRLDTGTVELASRVDGPDGGPVDGAAIGAAISPDGGYVVFTALRSEDEPAQGHRRDLAAGRTELVTRGDGPAGAPAANGASVSDVSAGGGCVAFDSGSLAGSSDYQQTYLRVLRDNCAATDPARPDGPTGPTGPTGEPRGTDADVLAPVLSGVKLTRTRFRVGRRATALAAARRVKRGTVLRFRSSEAARLTVTFRRGRTARRITRRIKPGPGRITLTGRLGKRKMKPGRYSVRLVARDAAGNASKPVTRRLVVLEERRR